MSLKRAPISSRSETVPSTCVTLKPCAPRCTRCACRCRRRAPADTVGVCRAHNRQGRLPVSSAVGTTMSRLALPGRTCSFEHVPVGGRQQHARLERILEDCAPRCRRWRAHDAYLMSGDRGECQAPTIWRRPNTRRCVETDDAGRGPPRRDSLSPTSTGCDHLHRVRFPGRFRRAPAGGRHSGWFLSCSGGRVGAAGSGVHRRFEQSR